MKIGELASTTGTDIQTVRFYEREGLLPAPARTAANYRVYTDQHVGRLAFIRHCRSLDMSLAEVRVLLQFKDAPQDDCNDVDALLDQHIGHVVQRIRELKALERELKQLRSRCGQAHEAKGCGILGQLTQHAIKASRTERRDKPHVRGSHQRRASITTAP